MKKILIAIYFLSFGVRAQIQVTVDGIIKGIENRTVYLVIPELNVNDSLQSLEDKFTFRANLKEPMIAKVKVHGSTKMIEVFLVNGVVSLRSEFNQTTGTFANTHITGSTEHDVYRKLLGAEGGGLTPDELTQMREFIRVNDTTSINQLKAKKNLEMEEAHSKMLVLFREHANRYAAAYFIYSARIDSRQTRIRERFKELYSLLNEPIKQSYYGTHFIENFNRK